MLLCKNNRQLLFICQRNPFTWIQFDRISCCSIRPQNEHFFVFCFNFTRAHFDFINLIMIIHIRWPLQNKTIESHNLHWGESNVCHMWHVKKMWRTMEAKSKIEKHKKRGVRGTRHQPLFMYDTTRLRSNEFSARLSSTDRWNVFMTGIESVRSGIHI